MRPIVATALFLFVAQPARAAWPVFLPPPRPVTEIPPEQACRSAVAAAATQAGIPVPLALGIAQVESGRRGADGSVAPWPWSINVEGTDHVYPTEAAAIAGVQAFQAAGARSIDVGCMQVNLMYHPDAFATLADGFDPARNAAYAMRFLLELRGQVADWPQAAARYHSATPELGASYLRKVEAAMADDGGVVVAAAPPARQAGAIHLAATTVGVAAHGRSLADYRLIPIALVGRK